MKCWEGGPHILGNVPHTRYLSSKDKSMWDTIPQFLSLLHILYGRGMVGFACFGEGYCSDSKFLNRDYSL